MRATSTVSRYSSRLGPSNHGVRSLSRDDVVAVERADRNRIERAAREERREVGRDALEDVAVEVHEVHLVDGEREVLDAEQLRDARVAPRLLEHAVPRVDEQNRHVGRRGAGGHVARVLLVSGRVGQDELAPARREVAVRDVDRDALLALGAEAVGEEREIDRTGRPVLRRLLDRLDLILVDRRASRTAAVRSACSCRRRRCRPCRCAGDLK